MSVNVEEDLQAYYKSLVETQWDSIQAPPINWSALRSYILSHIPFYASALQLVDIIDTGDKKDLPSFGFTNGHQIFISPKMYVIHSMVVEKSGKEWFKTPELGITFTLLHEIGHLIFDSFGRLQHRDPKMWNVATDYQINQFVSRIMKESGIFRKEENYTQFMKVLRDNFLLDPGKYHNMSAESTYDDLYRVGANNNDYSGWSLNGDCEGMGDPNAQAAQTPEEQMAKDIIKSELQDYTAKNADKLPGQGSSFGREFEVSLEPPKVRLRDVLKHCTDRDSTEDYSWTNRGSRMDHMMSDGIKLPVVADVHPDKVKKVLFVLDSSGSMTSDQLNDAMNIVREILVKHTKNPVWLIVHTSEVVVSCPIEKYNQIPTNISGGTAFMPVLEEIKRLEKEDRIIPSAVIWLTDLYGELSADDYNKKNFPFFKRLSWIVSGSDLEAPIGRNFHIDEV